MSESLWQKEVNNERQVYNNKEILDNYHNVTVDSLVVKHCLAKGFISEEDVNESSRRYLWLRQVITMKLLAIELEIFDDVEVTVANLDECYKAKQDKANEIIETISQCILMSLPTYRH
ncbi:hypothetical protein BBM40_19630 [Vibrio parahaemolyticus]|uniref:hypothetical protein n=1 Tax=Vibrio parahaemolyticus TaxID=670 RepID=UPI00084B7CA8|nr:hypothetical protein [Vibrio parahaemolyticus]MDG2678142.1 hypothetical protein [Vibrio parahaemolyticus]ODZ45241.1 hypothetical protein BBM40_19630 [Vibrio parahaemolyticus]HCG7969232.1 hypothetical protein [Vibrio parahaemolyticus]